MVMRKKAGFTLVEIVLVLAIAGLILAMVLLALPQTERSRRDTQRKGDLGRLQTQIEFYASNHSGSYPPESPAASLNSNPDFGGGGSYAPAHFIDPSTQVNYFAIGAGTGHIQYQLGNGTSCSGAPITSARQFVLHMTLENGTGCIDNL
jgi:prepilin-type N-terminal cleavage/methylation domain-containing protein